MTDAKGIKDLARVAKNSSTRAYAGHMADFRHVLNKGDLNLTEYARSFGIYLVVHNTMSKSNLAPKESSKKGKLGKRPSREDKEEDKKAKATDGAEGEGSSMFTRRLQKSQIKELQTKFREA